MSKKVVDLELPELFKRNYNSRVGGLMHEKCPENIDECSSAFDDELDEITQNIFEHQP